MAARIYTSAIERLNALPEVFTGSELTVLFGWKSAIASSYLAHWRRAGLIKSLGGRSDVHMNLLANRQVNPELALRRAFPRAVKVAVDVLRAAGWTTQIPARPEVAVPQSSSRYSITSFELTTRSDKWFSVVQPGIERGVHGIDRLKPAWALVDMIHRARDRRIKHAWLLDPEDLDLESVRNNKHLATALQAFDLPADCLLDNGYETLSDNFAQSVPRNA